MYIKLEPRTGADAGELRVIMTGKELNDLRYNKELQKSLHDDIDKILGFVFQPEDKG